MKEVAGRPVNGSCLCGAFHFQVLGTLDNVRLCHCDLCRRGNGSAFSANCRVPRSGFTVLKDAGTLRRYESSPGAWRVFCGQCGSPAYSEVENDPDHIRIRLGTLEREASAKIVAHVWVGSKAAWDLIEDSLPCFQEAADPPMEARQC
ncbi:hypothetical protein SZ64_08885 [Erythrobacter sp. SG61-1L]|nr:hypothetical protein SZ64_08885 [Erythrobacter sp. SG61-1L]